MKRNLYPLAVASHSSIPPSPWQPLVYFLCLQIWLVQSLSRVRLSATPWTAARQASLSFTIPQSLLKLTSIESVIPFNQLFHPLLFPSPAFNLSQHQGLFQWVGSSHQVAKVLELQFQHQSFQWIYWFDLLSVQGTLKSLLQHQVWSHQFFSTQPLLSSSHIHT